MTTHEIVALRCPSCGKGITEPSREMLFGAEFRCDSCSITSVLIIDRALVPLSILQKQGERVCTACGRVAQRDARFCQEGHPLVQRCMNSTLCSAEFAVDHQVCDYCGWPQRVKPGTSEAEALAFDRAVRDLASPSPEVLEHDLTVIIAGDGGASDKAKTEAASAIHSLLMDPAFRLSRNDYIERRCWEALGSLGPAARQAFPLLRQRIEKIWSGGNPCTHEELSALVAISPEEAIPILQRRIESLWSEAFDGARDLLSFLGKISPENALVYCSRRLKEGHSDSENIMAVHTAFAMGKVSIPTLEKFCGTFSGRRGKLCTAAITALRNGEKTLSLR